MTNASNPVTEGWTVDPWGGVIDDKFIYGIGESNMKAGDAVAQRHVPAPDRRHRFFLITGGCKAGDRRARSHQITRKSATPQPPRIVILPGDAPVRPSRAGLQFPTQPSRLSDCPRGAGVSG
jgi:hypothetical protein